MTNWANSLVAALFAWALVFAPAIHVAAGHTGRACAPCDHDNPAGHCPAEKPAAPHDAAHCAICQLAHAPLLASAPVVYFLPEPAPVALPEIAFLAPAVPAAYRLPFSCGPPA